MLRKVLTAISLSMLLGILAGGNCFGQIKSGTITGRVTDSTGAVIPGAKVSVVNSGTHVAVDTVSNETGDYTAPYLESATYDVTVIKEGFTTFTQTGVVVGTSTTVQVDAQLNVGRTATVVEVKSSGATSLQTETATVGDSVNAQVIDAIPNMNHNPYYFATLQPGVVGKWQMIDTTSSLSFGIGMYSRDEASAFSVNGGAAFTSMISVDGVNVMGSSWNEANILPNPDAIQEVKTYTNNYDASIGRGQGAVAIVTKSGTNNYHGSVFGRLRNDALNANSFGNNAQGIKKAPFKVGTYGATFGGPIKKNTAFFFVSWQGLAHNTVRQDTLAVPTLNERKGDFSTPGKCDGITSTCVNVLGTPTPLQVFNPFMGSLYSTGVYAHPAITGPNGMSDMSQFADPKMLAMISAYGLPNRTATDDYGSNNYFFQGVQTFRSNNINSRVDLVHGRHSFYATGGIEYGQILTPGPWGSKVPYYYPPAGNASNTAIISDHNPYLALGDTITVSPSMVVDARIGVQRTHAINGNAVFPNFDYNAVGIPASVQAILPIPGTTPTTGSTTPWTMLDSSVNSHKNDHQTNWNATGGLTKVKGNWTYKFGAEYLVAFANTPNPYDTGTLIAPDGCAGCQYTDVNYNSVGQNVTAATQGLAPAGWETGANNLQIPGAQSMLPAIAEKYFALYTHNQWKVTPRLTLNLGLRWELQPGPTERFNRFTGWNPNGTNPIGTAAGFGSQGELFFAGVNGNSRHLWPTVYDNISPRLGVAYRVSETLVARGGYGISYIPTNSGMLPGPYSYGMYPYGLGLTQIPEGATPAGYVVAPVEDPSVSPIVQATGPNASAPQNYGAAPNLYPRNYANGMIQQWNFFLEKKLSSWLLSVGYVGSHGSDLPVLRLPINGENGLLPSNIQSCYHAGLNCPANDSSLSGAGYLQTGSDPFGQNVTNPFNPTGTQPFVGTLRQAKIPRGIVDGPWPLFYGQTVPQTWGYSDFNALQVEVKHQVAHGLMLDVFYTWSKELDYSSFEAENNQAENTNLNAYSGGDLVHLRNNRKLGTSDMPQRFLANLVYDLPFGSGHSLNPNNRVAKFAVSGWAIGAVEMSQSGFPIDVQGDSGGSLDGRANKVAGQPLQVPKALQHWYDGNTKVTLPDGRQITRCNYCFLKYNVDAFSGPTVANPSSPGTYLNDTYWTGNQALDYGGLRAPILNNLNLTLRRSFKVTERVGIDFQANVTNFLNHPNFQTFNLNLGNINTATTGGTNTLLGQGTGSSSYGTYGLTTFDSRQVELQMTVRF